MPSGSRPLPVATLTQSYVATWHHKTQWVNRPYTALSVASIFDCPSKYQNVSDRGQWMTRDAMLPQIWSHWIPFRLNVFEFIHGKKLFLFKFHWSLVPLTIRISARVMVWTSHCLNQWCPRSMKPGFDELSEPELFYILSHGRHDTSRSNLRGQTSTSACFIFFFNA